MDSFLKKIIIACIILTSTKIFSAENIVVIPSIQQLGHGNVLKLSNQELTHDSLRTILNSPVNYQAAATPLTMVPNLILDISGNELVTLPNELTHLNKMIYLNAQRNKLESLPEQMDQLQSIRIIDLTDNNIKSLGGVAQLKQLEELWLCSNSLRTLPEELENLSNLRSLDMSFNDLTDIPQVLFKLPKLTILFLHGNYLSRVQNLQEILTKLPALGFKSWITTSRKVLMARLSVSIIPPYGTLLNFSESNLTDINGINQLHVLTGDIYTPVRLLHNLTLKLSSNQLTELPKELFMLRSLWHLNISNNRLLGLQSWIEYLTNLSSLDLSWNQLTSLPENIGRLQKLNALFLNNNRLTSLPSSIANLQNLEQLDIRHNPFDQIPLEDLLKIGGIKSLLFDPEISKDTFLYSTIHTQNN